MRTLKLFITMIFMLTLVLSLAACVNTVKFTVNFDSNGGTEVLPVTTDGTSTVSIPDNPTKEGYIFDGWYRDNGSFETPFTANSLLDAPLSSDMTVYAKWTVGYAYSVTFDSNGGTEVFKMIGTDYGIFHINEPTAPTKEGFVFVGWYSDTLLTTAWDFEMDEVTSSMTLYAKWEANEYSINYNMYSNEFIPGTSVVLAFDETIIQVESGRNHTAALTSNKKLFLWGSNSNGQLGDGTIINSSIPLDITSEFNLSVGETIDDVALGDNHSAVLTSEGRLFLWGSNSNGQLGDGTQIDSSNPLDITSEFNLDDGETITNIELGAYHSSALTSSGRIFTWGCNWSGRLGNGLDSDSSVPYDITNQFNFNPDEYVVTVSLGTLQSSALTSEGRLFMWGNGSQGTIGTGGYYDSLIPLDITNRFGLQAEEMLVIMSMGETHSSALTSNNRIFVWGSGDFGELGEPGSWQHINPFEITSEFNLNVDDKIAFIEMGIDFSSAITLNGRVFTWGFNSSGQLGDGTIINKDYPVEINDSFNLHPNETIENLSLGYGHSSALTSEGRILIWGSNSHGQLGNNTIIDELKPSSPVFIFYKLQDIRIYNFNASIEEYIPLLEGYIFDGWFTDETLTTIYIEGEMPPENIILYGQWIED